MLSPMWKGSLGYYCNEMGAFKGNCGPNQNDRFMIDLFTLFPFLFLGFHSFSGRWLIIILYQSDDHFPCPGILGGGPLLWGASAQDVTASNCGMFLFHTCLNCYGWHRLTVVFLQISLAKIWAKIWPIFGFVRYMTPTSYLELIKLFTDLWASQRSLCADLLGRSERHVQVGDEERRTGHEAESLQGRHDWIWQHLQQKKKKKKTSWSIYCNWNWTISTTVDLKFASASHLFFLHRLGRNVWKRPKPWWTSSR